MESIDRMSAHIQVKSQVSAPAVVHKPSEQPANTTSPSYTVNISEQGKNKLSEETPKDLGSKLRQSDANITGKPDMAEKADNESKIDKMIEKLEQQIKDLRQQIQTLGSKQDEVSKVQRELLESQLTSLNGQLMELNNQKLMMIKDKK